MACTTANISSLANGFLGVLGVAGTDAAVLTQPGLPVNAGATYPAGYDQVLDLSFLQDYVSVYPLGEFNVLYESSAKFGDALIAGVAGGVVPAGATPDARAVIGRCTNPGGVVVSGTTLGLAFINTL
jgi:hypothetical protein